MLQTILSEKYAKERAILEKTFYTLGKNKEDKARRMKVLAARHLIDIHNGIHEVLQDKDHKTRENLPYLFALYALSLAKFAGENAVRDGIEIQRGRRNQAKSRTDKQGIIVLRKHFTKQDKKQTDPQLWEAIKDAIDDEGSLEIKGYTFEFIPDYVENDIKKGRIKQTDSDGNEYLFSFDVFRKTKSLK